MPPKKPEDNVDAINLIRGRSYLRSARSKEVTPVHAGVKSQPIPSKSVMHTPPPEVEIEDYEPHNPQVIAHERRMTRLMLTALMVGVFCLGAGLWILYLKLS